MDFGDFVSAAPSSSEVELDRELYAMLGVEAKRYQNFFATLDEHQSGLLPRDVVLAFYGKSSLTEQEIAEMYQLIKSLQLVADPHAMNETEFITGMHFIVCMTKRNLAKLPPTFPKYLFPTLDLTPSTSVSQASYGISSMPSLDKEDLMRGGGGGSFAASTSNTPSGFSGVSAGAGQPVVNGEIEKLQDAKSLHQLLEKEIHNKRLEASVLVKVDQSESNALQSLHGCLHLIAENVEKLGYFVPATARALDALDDFSNLLRSHVQTTKQEIQSLEISAQMLSVTSEPNNNGGLGKQRDDPFKEIAKLTQELTALQQQAAQLHQRKEILLQQVNENKLKANQSPPPVPVPQQQAVPTKPLDSSFGSSSAASAMGGASVEGMTPTTHIGVLSPTPSSSSVTAGWGDFGATGTTSSSSQQEVWHSESVEHTESNPFEFGAAPFPVSASASAAPAPAPAAVSDPVATTSGGAASNDFSWGDFS